MKIRVFPSPSDTYNSIVIDTDSMAFVSNQFHPDALPSVYVSELIEDLISRN